MASHTPGGQPQKSRHRITNINLEPFTSNYDISLKILVDGQELRLAPIQRGMPLSWGMALSCDVGPSARVEIRVYEKHLLSNKRIGALVYTISTVADKLEARIDFDTKRFTAVLSFPASEEADRAAAAALSKAQEKEKKTRILERLGPTREALKAILDFGQALSELHPAAKVAFGVCTIAWNTLEKQEQCDASIEKLVVDLADMLPMVERVKKAATLPQLRDTVKTLMNLIEDASTFVIEYRTDGGPVQRLRAAIGSNAQEQVQDLRGRFQNLKEAFDRGVVVQTLEAVDAVHLTVHAVDETVHAVHETVNTVHGTVHAVHETVNTVHGTVHAVHEVLLTSAQRALRNELKPVESARYDSSRACLVGTRSGIINKIVDWSQKRDTYNHLLWVYGQAGVGKSSIATSVCQVLNGRNLLAAEFFCKRDSSEGREPQQVLTTIVYGLACLHPGYAKSVADAIQGDPRLRSSPIEMQYDNLVEGPLKSSSEALLPTNLVVIVDALDEYGTNESRCQLLAYLHRMSRLVPWLRIIITSRPDPVIQSFFDNWATSGVDRENMYEYSASNDIHSYIQFRMHGSLKSEHLPPDAAHLLTERADGLFIWAKTACELILNDHNPRLLFGLVVGGTGLDGVSNPLDDLYATAIKASIGNGGERSAHYVQECLGIIIVCSTRTPLSVASLSNLLGDQVERSVLQYVVDSLGSVLYIDDAQGGVVRAYHHSFTDYMTSPARSGRFCVDLEQRNTDLARCCLRTMVDGLKFNICGLETSHIRNIQVPNLSTRVDTAITPELRYSCQYWASHLTQSRKGELENLLKAFLLRPTVLYWIEALSLLGRLDAAIYSALELSKWCEELDDVHQCARDVYRFILAFYDPISTSTPHLYVSALGFCPKGTTFSRYLRAMFQNTLVVTRGAEERWPPWLRCVSHPAGIRAIAISKDGRRIISGSDDNTVRVWDADTGAALGNPLEGHSGYVMSVGFSPDGRHIVSGSHDKTVRVWDADTGVALGSPLKGHSGRVNSVGFSPDGRWIVSGSEDNTVRVWDADTCESLGSPLEGHLGPVMSVRFSPDGRHIVSGSEDKTVRVWDADTGVALGSPLKGHLEGVLSVEFSPDGRHIVSGSHDKTARVWDADTCELLGSPLEGHLGPVMSVRFSPDGRHIVSGSEDKMVQVWDADTGAALGSPLEGHSGRVNSVGFSPDGRWIVSGSEDNTVRVWDADTCESLGSPLEGHLGPVMSVRFSPDGRRIVSGSEDKTVRVWDADTGAALGSPLKGHSEGVLSVEFSPDGRRIISGSEDKTVRVWDADTGVALGSPLKGHLEGVLSVGFCPDGRRIVSGSHDKTVQVWDTDTGVALGSPLKGHLGPVMSVGFSPDGRRIVSGSEDKMVRVWDADTGAALDSPLEGHSGWVNSVGFSPDGRHIVSGSHDKTVRVWDLSPKLSVSLPHNTSRMSEGLSKHGWVCDKNTNALLIWLPEEYRRHDVDDSLFVMSKDARPRPVAIDSSRFMHGHRWESVYTS